MRDRELLGAIGQERRSRDDDDPVVLEQLRPSPTKLTTADLADLPPSALTGVEPGKLTLDDVAPRPGPAIYRDAHGDAPEDHPRVREALARRGGGAPLPDLLRQQMEARFRASFAGVRVHTDAVAAEAARAISANAFTVGQDIFFADGQAGSEAVLAHELTHVVQHQQGRTAAHGMSRPDDALEHEARSVGARVTRGLDADLDPTPVRTSDGVTGAIFRDSEPRKDLTSDMVSVTKFEVKQDGNITSTKKGAKEVTVSAPGTTISATVALASGVKLTDDPVLEIGPTQTINGSRRELIYRRPDQSTFSIVMGVNGAHRDAQWDDKGDKLVASVPEPWYSRPTRLSNHGSADTVFFDQPSFDMPISDGDGTLVRVAGSESFSTSIAAKREGTILHLQNHQWSIPWDMAIDPGGTGTGGKISGTPGGPPPSRLDGEIAVNAVDQWGRFDSVEDAKKYGWRGLINMLVDAKANDPRSFGFMAQAINELNPQFETFIKCENCYSYVGNDALTLHITGMQSTSAEMSLDSGDTGWDVTNWTTVLDARQVFSGTSIHFEGVVGDHRFSKSYQYPFAAVTDWVPMEGSDKRYYIKVALKSR